MNLPPLTSVCFRVQTNEHRLVGHVVTAERFWPEIEVDPQN